MPLTMLDRLLFVFRNPTSVVSLWFTILAPPIAWTAHLLVSYPLVGVVCATGFTLLLHAVTLVTLAVSALAAYVGFEAWLQTSGDHKAVRGPETGYKRYMAAVGMLLGTLFVYVIAMEGLPNFFLDPCQG